MQLHKRTAAIGDTEIFYREAGAGSPLLLLHGFGHSSTAWLRTMPILSAHHKTLAPDLPGYGRSSIVLAPDDPPYFAKFVIDFLERLELFGVDVVGNSLGGLISLLAALERPDLFRKIVLVDPAGFTKGPIPPLDDALLALMGFWLSLPRSRALIRAGYASGFFDAGHVDEESVTEIVARSTHPEALQVSSRTLHEMFHFSRHLDRFHARLASLKAPTMVVWGQNDPVLPAKDANTARRVLPASRIEVLERCGHLPHIELPTAFSSLVLNFLDAA